MKKNTRLLATLILLTTVLGSGIFGIISLASDAAVVLPDITANVPQGEFVLFEQDYEDIENNKCFTKSSASDTAILSGYPAIQSGGTGYTAGNVAVMDYSTLNWTDSTGVNYVSSTNYPVGHLYYGTASRSDLMDYVPTPSQGYVLTFDFCNAGGTSTEYVWVNIYDSEATNANKGFKIPTSEFTNREWYRITITYNSTSRTVTKTQLTGDGKGATTSVSAKTGTLSGSRNNQICITMYPTEATSSNSAALRGEERQRSCFMFDNLKMTTMAFPKTTTTVTALAQDYENTAANKVFAQSWIQGQNDKPLKDKDGNNLPLITEGTDGWEGGLVADFDFTKLDWSTANSVYPMGWLYPKGMQKQDYNRVEYIPSLEEGYTFSFDFHCITGYNQDYLWINVYDATGLGGSKRGFKVNTSQFENNTWYHVEIKNSTAAIVATKTVLNGAKKGESSNLVYTGATASGSDSSSSGRNNMVGITFYPYAASNGDTTEGRQQSHYQIDNISLTTERFNEITAQISDGSAISTSAVPMLAAYNSKGMLTALSYGTITDAVAGKVKFDISSAYDAFCLADSVKVLLWNSLQDAKPLTGFVDIGNKIYPGVENKNTTTSAVTVTEDMIPGGNSNSYTLMAYAVPNTTEANNIPSYNAKDYKLLALDQLTAAPTEFIYEKALYDYQTQDIVLIISNGKETKTSLIDGFTPPDITNIVLQLGADETQLNFTWFSLDTGIGEIRFAKASDMVGGKLPTDCIKVTAERTASKKTGYVGNKATITGLQENTDYYYVLVNGEDMTEPKKISVGSFDSSFSFAFAGDPQIGRGYDDSSLAYDCIDDDYKSWGLTLKQMTTSEEFRGVEFLMSAGDQINTHLDDFEAHELQWDAYSNHEELLSLPTVTVLGNHDADKYSIYPFHVNEPNVLLKPDGKPYGATTRYNDYITGADYYFTYNKVLFMVLNTNTFVATDDSEAATAKDKAAADEHAAFIARVMDETKNMDINWTIVLYHQSPYGTSYHNDDRYKNSTSDVYYRSEQYAYINIRRFLVPVLYENGVDVIFSGHDHCYTRSHVIKPDTDGNGNYLATSTVTPYANGTYVYADGTTLPSFVPWTDTHGNVYYESKVSSKPIKVYNPDGIVHITGATASGSQPNPASYDNLYTAVKGTANTRHLSRIDITENSIKIVTYNLGTNTTEEITLFDSFEIVSEPTEITSANLSIDDDIDLRYFVTPGYGIDTAKLAMRFTINGKSETVADFITDGDKIIFTLSGIAPQFMGDSIKAELLYDGEVIATKDEYSIRAYVLSMLSKSPTEKLECLLKDLLNLGAAYQLYTGYKTDALVNAGITGGSAILPEVSDNIYIISDSKDTDIAILESALEFNAENRIYITFKAPSLDGITVKLNGTEVTPEMHGAGEYIVYSDAISPLEYDAECVFVIYRDGNVVQCVKNSANSYAYSVKDAGTAESALAIALYRLGVAAEQYAK